MKIHINQDDPPQTDEPHSSSGNTSVSAAPVLTRHRLWVLSVLLDCTQSQIADLSGWPRSVIQYRIRKWSLGFFVSNAFWESEEFWSRFAESLSFESVSVYGPGSDARLQVQARLLRQPIDWEVIDALPTAVEIASWRNDSPSA